MTGTEPAARPTAGPVARPERPRVGILFGGPSPEHDVSCSSALAVLRAIPRDRFEPVAIGIDHDRRFVLADPRETSRLLRQRPAARAIDSRLSMRGRPVRLQPRPGTTQAEIVSADADAEAEQGQLLGLLDVAFPVLHGTVGEDGVLQGLLEMLALPYAGCGVLASALCMDKVAMKRAFLAEGLPITPHVWFTAAQWHAPGGGARLVEGLTWPLFVKPASMGSSLGVSRVDSAGDLGRAVAEALRWDGTVIAEQAVIGREVECGVLGGDDPRASVVGEVMVSDGAFDFQQKYQSDADPMIVPAHLDPAVSERVRELSVRAFRAVGGWGLVRADFLIDQAGNIFLNEVNTMPGFTAHSMYPKVWAAAGLAYPDLLTRLIDLAFTRPARPARLGRSSRAAS